MTTDIERELRELFRDKAGEAPVSTLGASGAPPQQVLRRGRRRQVGTVLGSALVAVALAVTSFAGLRALLRSDADPFQTGRYEVFERTATIEAFTVTSPSDWYLVNQWPLSMLIAVEGSSGVSSPCPADLADTCQMSSDQTSSPIPVPHGLPMLQLSNVDMGLTTNACADGLPAAGAALYVALDARPPVGGDAPPIPEFPPGTGLPPEGDGPCGPGRYAHFKVNGKPLFAWIGTGSGVSDEDRETVETSYETMSAIPDWELAPSDQTTPAYVVAGGTTDVFDDWRLELRPSERNVAMSLIGEAPTASDGFLVPDHPIDWCCKDSTMGVLFGAVQKGATGVEARPSEVDPIAGTIFPVPPSLGSFDFDLFFIEGTGGLPGTVVPLGIDAEQTVSPPPAAGSRDEVVEFSGTYETHDWAVRFTGSFVERDACVSVDVKDVRFDPLCPWRVGDTLASGSPSMHGWVTDDLHLLAGSAPAEVVEIRFVSDDDAIVSTSFRCQMGPIGWTDPDVKVCVLLLPTSGSGITEYLDATGKVVSEQGIGWGSLDPEVPVPVDPVHGGTYWAVYPWVGAPGSPEADDVSAQLLAEFGIAAFPGEIACDDGAAAALGTDAAHGIAVYFETQAEANEFALQAGLLGHEADPLIAHVTTYCLD